MPSVNTGGHGYAALSGPDEEETTFGTDTPDPTHECQVCQTEQELSTPYTRIDVWCSGCETVTAHRSIE